MHLNSDQFVDLAEGTRPEGSAPHLAGCEPCRAQLRELRAMLSAARNADVPEPSPLFWDHLSARVSDAVAEEGAPRERSRYVVPGWLAVAAALLIAVVVSSRSTAPARVPAPLARAEFVSNAPAAPELLDDLASGNDPSLNLVAFLTDEADLDTAREAGLAARGSAEHAVMHMSDGELRELRRLLKDEMTRSGA